MNRYFTVKFSDWSEIPSDEIVKMIQLQNKWDNIVEGKEITKYQGDFSDKIYVHKDINKVATNIPIRFVEKN